MSEVNSVITPPLEWILGRCLTALLEMFEEIASCVLANPFIMHLSNTFLNSIMKPGSAQKRICALGYPGYPWLHVLAR